MMEPLAVMDPWRHAFRGAVGATAAVTLLTNALKNRKALLSLRPQLSALQVATPSRNALAIAVFVGVFRFVERLEADRRRGRVSKAVEKASVVASVLAILCVHPKNRTPLVALASTHAATLWFRDLLATHPELASLKYADFLVFLASGGWIMYSTLFHPESYEPSHMKTIVKYSLTPRKCADELQAAYRQGLNPHPCEGRHPGRDCTEFFWRTFLWQVLRMGLRIYLPVHLTTWLLALRHRAVRNKPLLELLQRFVVKLVRSAMYYIGYVLIGWTIPCYTKSFAERSIARRKVQFFLCGSIPAASLLFESPSRRRPIGVILSSYAFVSMGTVLSNHPRFQWLQQGSGPVRSVLDVVSVGAAAAYAMDLTVQSNGALRRLLLGSKKKSETDHAKANSKLEGSNP
ncbi:hypothetical protein Poli38472_008834 [Pythium oligandrum]|uniref:Transmembrane protein 135 N-terminal domain-containing protein n=1 Tax=Pythium oligandrum TaxID=41045 RepID=A0A8K1C4A9_PYTOL|nr:hypothetical protein Poli38472_008834 [Pythium oligandrum]|eukprot:TMW56186.1 hypothetical protein Poli38472_008834 [Pythium oligandrum]